MIGYKGTYDSQCKDITYDVGKTYKFIGKLKICNRGFHFCQELKDVFAYYPYNKEKGELIVYKIDTLNGKVIRECDKSVTNKLKILEPVDISDYYKFDDNNNLICYNNHNYIYIYKYDQNNNLIWQKDCFGGIIEHKYDENNNLIWQKDAYDAITEWKYDKNNNIIWGKHPDGSIIESEYKYDKNNNCIWQKYPNDIIYEYAYDENNNMVWKKDCHGIIYEWRYDDNNNLIWQKERSKNCCVMDFKEYKYDKNNNLVFERGSNNYTIKYKYDKNNNLILKRFEGDLIIFYRRCYKYKYDKNNQLVKMCYRGSNSYDNYTIKIK